jgi:hypothetical protein
LAERGAGGNAEDAGSRKAEKPAQTITQPCVDSQPIRRSILAMP